MCFCKTKKDISGKVADVRNYECGIATREPIVFGVENHPRPFTRGKVAGMGHEMNPNWKPGKCANPATKWAPGQSGNPAGASKLRHAFNLAFAEALASEGTPQEAAALLWKAARKGEAWAIQNLCQRFAPIEAQLKITHERGNDGFDYRELSDGQLQQIREILEGATIVDVTPEPPQLESGDSPAELQ
jgi:hypothetical protein